MPEIIVRPVDFDSPADVENYLRQLNAYACDPMGEARPLAADILQRVGHDLAKRPQTYCLLAFHNADCIGFATCFGGYSTYQARPLLNIHDIAVLPAWRGRSVAKKLLQAIKAMGRELDCCKITLEVRDDNIVARRLYEHFGFKAASCDRFMALPL